MKKIAVALALVGACSISNAAIVRWDVSGTSENVYDSNLYIDSFIGSMWFDTEKYAANPVPSSSHTSYGVLSWSFRVTSDPRAPGLGGGCSGGNFYTVFVGNGSLVLEGLDSNTDCAMGFRLTAPGMGGPFASAEEALARTYDLSSPDLIASVYMFSQIGHPSIDVTTITQRVNGRVVASTDANLVPEPATLALAGLAGLGAFASRRRRKA